MNTPPNTLSLGSLVTVSLSSYCCNYLPKPARFRIDADWTCALRATWDLAFARRLYLAGRLMYQPLSKERLRDSQCSGPWLREKTHQDTTTVPGHAWRGCHDRTRSGFHQSTLQHSSTAVINTVPSQVSIATNTVPGQVWRGCNAAGAAGSSARSPEALSYPVTKHRTRSGSRQFLLQSSSTDVMNIVPGQVLGEPNSKTQSCPHWASSEGVN